MAESMRDRRACPSHGRSERHPGVHRPHDMPTDNRRLTRHLVVAVIVKIAVLTGLWLTFFHQPGAKTGPLSASDDTAAHVLGAARQGVSP